MYKNNNVQHHNKKKIKILNKKHKMHRNKLINSNSLLAIKQKNHFLIIYQIAQLKRHLNQKNNANNRIKQINRLLEWIINNSIEDKATIEEEDNIKTIILKIIIKTSTKTTTTIIIIDNNSNRIIIVADIPIMDLQEIKITIISLKTIKAIIINNILIIEENKLQHQRQIYK